MAAAGIGLECRIEPAAPDNHFASRPNCRMPISTLRCIGGANWSPSICCRVVPPAGVESFTVSAAKNDHLVSCPNGRERVPWKRRVNYAYRTPDIRGRIVATPRVRLTAGSYATPNYHYAAC